MAQIQQLYHLGMRRPIRWAWLYCKQLNAEWCFNRYIYQYSWWIILVKANCFFKKLFYFSIQDIMNDLKKVWTYLESCSAQFLQNKDDFFFEQHFNNMGSLKITIIRMESLIIQKFTIEHNSSCKNAKSSINSSSR
jgi:hypothetical protein